MEGILSHPAGTGSTGKTFVMGHEIVYCSRCQTRLMSADFDRGRAQRINHSVVCTDCLVPSEIAAPAKPAPGGATSRKVPAVPRPSSSARIEALPESEATRRPVVLWAGAGGGLLLLIAGLAFVMRPAPPPPAPVVAAPPKKPSVAAPVAAVQGLDRDLAALAEELGGLLARKNFRDAMAQLDAVRKRSEDPRWQQKIDGWDRDVNARARERFAELMQAGARARERKSAEELKTARDELFSWGPAFEGLLKDFDAAYAAAVAVPAPPPDAPKAPPAPPPAPVLTKAAAQYQAAWESALGLASRRELTRAVALLQAAVRDAAAEEDLRAESAADLQDLRRLQSLQEDFLKALKALKPGENLALELLQEDGSRKAARVLLLNAGERRLELAGDPRFVEYEDVAACSLARLFARQKAPSAAEDARALAVACIADGDAEGAKELLGTGTLSARHWAFAAAARKPPPPEEAAARRNEWAARKLFYEAEAEAPSLATRASAMEKYAKLADGFGTTAFVQRVAGEIAARKAECREYVLTAARLSGKGVFSLQKTPVLLGKEKDKEKLDMQVWRAREEAEENPDIHVEATFYALPGVEYKGWALVGGCCVSTFSWLLQASEFTTPDKKTRKPLACDPGGSYAAPWEHKLRGLSSTHGGKDHSKAPKEPLIWEWLELPLPKYASGGLKTVRLIGGGKGMSVGAVVISADRAKKPVDEETRKLAAASLVEDLPPSALRAGKGEPDLQVQIPEARGMQLVYDLDLAKLRRPVVYDVDQRAKVTRPFDRIAYLLELQQGAEAPFVFVSMDAFTDDAGKIGIPDVETKAVFQVGVTNLNVLSNVAGVATGTRLEGGNIEFWPHNYGPHNAANVAGASPTVYDFGDGYGAPEQGYGCMQVHNSKGKHTIFAVNHWANGGGADIGIGNSPAGNLDWTFTASAKNYSSKRLRIFVRFKG